MPKPSDDDWKDEIERQRRASIPKRICKWHATLGKVGHYLRHKPTPDETILSMGIFDLRLKKSEEQQ